MLRTIGRDHWMKTCDDPTPCPTAKERSDSTNSQRIGFNGKSEVREIAVERVERAASKVHPEFEVSSVSNYSFKR